MILITNICIGTPKQCLDARVGFNAYYSLICYTNENGIQFIPEKSETFEDVKESIKNFKEEINKIKWIG